MKDLNSAYVSMPAHDLTAACRKEAMLSSLRKLGQTMPDEAEGFGSALDAVFQFSGPNPTDLSGHSRLTKKGMPLEWAFVWPGKDIRATIDPLPSGTSQDRLLRSLDLAGELASGLQTSVAMKLLGWQTEFALRYGAWIGLRVTENGPAHKLYLEVPQATSQLQIVRGLGCDQAEMLRKGFNLVMVGLQPDKGTVELYYRAKAISVPALRTLLQKLGLPDRSKEIVEQVGQLKQRRLQYLLPSDDIGFSVSYSPSGEPQAFTLYAYTISLLGMDSTVREHIVRYSDRQGWDISTYLAMSEAAQHVHFDINTWHGMAGFVVANSGPIHFTVGIAPLNATDGF